MVAFLLTVLAIAALLGSGVLLHLYLYAHGAITTQQRVHPILQQEFVTEEYAGEELLNPGLHTPVSLLTQYARRSLLLLTLLIAAGVMTVTLLVSYLH